mgnify:CR=1 FL=1
MRVELLVLEANAGVVNDLGSLGAALARTCLHDDVLITFTYGFVEVLLKLINTLSTIELLAHKFIFSHVVIQLPN